MPVSTKHKSFISVGTGLVHPSVHTKSHLHALELQQVLARFSSTNFGRNKNFKSRQIAQSPCIPKWLKYPSHYFIPHLTLNTDAKGEVRLVLL